MALLYSKIAPLGSKAIDFDLPGTDENNYSLNSFKDKKALIIIFMCNHCPYVIAVLNRIIAVQNDYADKGVQLVGINPNDAVNYPEDSFENMKKIVKEKNIPFPYLIDETQETARKYDAVCTPDIYVYGEERTLLYRGRIDDNWQEEFKVKQRDLRDALNAILERKPVFKKQIPSMGCSIKWK